MDTSINNMTDHSTDEVTDEKNPLNIKKMLAECNMLKSVFSSIGDAVYYTNRERGIISWNQAAEELTGNTKEDVLGKPCRDILKHQDEEGNILCDTKCPLELAMSEKRDFFEEVWMMTRSGIRKPVELRCSPVRDENDEIIGAVEVFRDRTKQKEIEHLKEEFLATVTHDLKSPMVSILAFLDILADRKYGEISENKIEYITHMRRAGKILLTIIGNIIDSSRIETKQMNLKFEDFSLNDFLQDLKNIFEPLAVKSGIFLDFSSPENTWVNADYNSIHRVFNNLISNAFRYIPEGGAIRIIASKNNERVNITVADTGKGIPESEHGKIFKKFTQVKGERRSTGLGLYITKKILEGHGSDIQFESSPGKGTAFFFSLPISKEEAPAEIPICCGKLLITGDYRDYFQPLSLALKEDKHTLEFATSGMEALQKATSFNPDVVLLFYPLPDLTIDEFRFAFSTNPEIKNIPFVLLTSFSLPEWEEKFASSIYLPLEMKVLRQSIQKILQSIRKVLVTQLEPKSSEI